MSFTDNYLELRKKKKENEKKTTAERTGHSFTDNYLSEREKSQALQEDIAPVRTTPVKTTTKADEERTWFSKGAFDDGYDVGDISMTILGTVTDIMEEAGAGILGMGERVVDAGAYLAGGVGNMFGADEFAEDTKKFISKDLYDEKKIAQNLLSGGKADEFSVLGEKSDSLLQSGGQLAATVGLQMVGVPWFVTTGLTSFGSEVENAFNQGATYGEAGLSAAISAGAEILTEKISGGISFGGKTLDDALTKNIARNISNKTVRTLSKLGLDMAGEGTEELLSGVMGAIGQKITYADDKELTELFSKEEALESFIGGAVLGGGMSGANVIKSAKSGVDYASGLTANEEKVVKKVYEDRVKEAEKNGEVSEKEKSKIYDEVLEEMEKGGISTDTIEEVLGGDTFQTYQNAVKNEDSLRETFNQLNQMKQGEMTGEQIDLRNELKEQLKELESKGERNQLKSRLGSEVMSLVQGDRLIESYNERSRKGQAFEADLTKYNEKQKAVVQKAIDSGILNNTRRTHEFVDMVSKISADKGVLFDFANNAKLKESGFAMDGKTINGFVTKDGVTLNIDSAKSLNSVVGHEITHVLEGTELYTALQSAVVEYAKTKGDYQGRYDSITKLYEGIEGANVDAELTADLVGDYLFTDHDFIHNLSTNHRNVFQKIYDEVKYLYKVATAGSKEARELEKVKRAFEKAYKEGGKAQKNTADSGTKYSLNEFDDGRRFVDVITDQTQFDGLDDKAKTKLAISIIKQRFAGHTVGIDNPVFVNGRSAAEYGHPVKNISSDIRDAKMRASTELDNLIDAGTNFRTQPDGADGHVHPNATGDFEYFDAIFKVGNEYYEGVVNIENVARGRLFKDVTKIKNITQDISSSYGNNPKSTFLRDNSMDRVSQQEESVKYSVSDSDGKKLSKRQQEYFKDSKMRNDNGELMVMYHGSQDAGFHVFDASMSDDNTSFFFVDRNDVAATYSGTSETYEAKAFRTAEDANKFFADIGKTEYEVVEKDGKYTLYDDGDEVATNESLSEIYDEFRDWEGVGYGDANYKVYLNLKNPLVVDAQGRNWNNVSREFSQEVYDRYHSLTDSEKTALADIAGWGEYGIFRDEILTMARSKANGKYHDTDLASAYEKLGGANANLFDAFSIAEDNFSEESLRQFAVKQMKTRDYAAKAKAEGYDGVIFKNIHDNGGYSNGSEGASTVAIAFESNQIKSVANDKPTADKDIRYSLSELDSWYQSNLENEDMIGADLLVERAANLAMPDSKIRDKNGNLIPVYHGTKEMFNVFDTSVKGGVNGTAEGFGIYTSDDPEVTEAYGNRQIKMYANITKPATSDKKTISAKTLAALIKDTCKKQAQKSVEDGEYDSVKDALFDTWVSNYVYTYDTGMERAYREVANTILQLNDNDMDIIQEVMASMAIRNYAEAYEFYHNSLIPITGFDGYVTQWENSSIGKKSKIILAFDSNQLKSADTVTYDDNGNVIPLRERFNPETPDIRRSLSDSEAPVYGNYNVFGKDIALEQETVAENATVEEAAPVVSAENATTMFPDDLAPIADDAGRIESLTDADAPPEMEAPYYEDNSEELEAEDPFEERDWYEVSNRKVNAYMYDHPEVKPFFQAEAAIMLDELTSTTKGEKWYNDHLYYESGGEAGFGGTKRHTSDSIATMRDEWNMSYADIEKGLRAIIEDHGAENIAAAKKIEFMLNERLLNGYKSFVGYEPAMDKFGRVPQNQDYINMLAESQIVDAYSKESFDALMAEADKYAPPISEEMDDIAPIAPIAEKPNRLAYEAVRPKKEKQPKLIKVNPDEGTANVMTEEPKVNKNKSGVWGTIKNSILDKGMIFEDISLKTGNRELQARWNSIRYADGKAQRRLENDLKPIMDTVNQSGKTKSFYEYLYHMLNVDRMTLEQRYDDTPNKPVFGNSITADKSMEAAKRLEQANPEFKQWAEEVYEFNRKNRELLVEGGVISQELADHWEKMYPHYVPIRRAGDTGMNVDVPLDTRRTGVNAPIKKATGGSRDILPLFDTLGQRTIQTYKAVAKNRFGVELKNALGAPVENEAIGLDEIIDSIDTHEELLQEGKNGKKPTFTVFENGEKVTFEIEDEMYDSMKPKNKAYNQFNESRAGKVLSGANNIRRGLLTEYNPAFMFTNPIKDTQDVLINSQHPARTYANYPRAVAELIGKNGRWYQEYMENGGDQNTYFESDTNTFAEEKKGIRKILGFPLDKISEANNFIERVPRLAEYIASRNEGRSIDVSMLDAARVTTNFAAGGDLTKFLNRNGVTFLNASVQGAIQQVRNVREAKANGLKGALTLAAKFAAAGLPSILLNHLLWDDDEEYAELSDYVKQNYYIVGKYDDGKFVRIPKGRALAVIQNGFEQMENLITGNDEADLATFGKLLISNLAPNDPIDNNIFSPIAQALRNETWYGEELVPTRLQDLPTAEQYDETTDSISRWLGERLPISPYKINYLLDQYSGGIGDTFLPMLTPESERGDNTLIAPVLDKFTVDGVMKNQNVSDFYSVKDELTTNAKKSDATDEDILMSKYMNSVNSELSKLYALKREVQTSDLPDDRKYNKVREIQEEIVSLTKEGLATYEDVYNTGDYAVIGDRHYVKKNGEWTKLTDKQVNKQEDVIEELGISGSDYWSDKDEYDFAYEYPEKYTVAKSVGGYEAYKSYQSDLYDIKADKDEDGKSINGSRKEKVADYINNLDADYGVKIILFKSEYNADDTYNYDIIEYLNNRQDISFEEEMTILKELGFEVDSDGNVSWD